MASLGKDLAQIRKEQNISFDDVYEATKIPKRIIRSIEDDSIFTDFEENPTYIRSYVRSYAKALSIDEKQIVYALDKREKNNYSGSLQKLMKNRPAQSFHDDKDDKPESEQETEKDEEKVPEDSPETKSDEEAGSLEEGPASQKTSKKPGVRSVDWADMGRQFQPLKTAKSRTWVGILVILFLLAVSGGIFYIYFYESTPVNIGHKQNTVNQQKSSQRVSTDSLELNIVPSANNDTSALMEKANGGSLQNETLETLPDTLSILLYAAYGKLEPVRVYTDIIGDVNPYWIEEGDALRFNFVNNLHIRGQHSRIVLFMNGHVVQNYREQFYNPETRLVEINRSYFEGEPKWLEPAPDTLAIDAPPPIVRERPTFN